MFNKKPKLTTLIYLLDDPDKEIFANISNVLIKLGPAIIPNLEKAGEKTDNPLVVERLEWIIHKINYTVVADKFAEWLKTDSEDLLEGAMLIAAYQYPDLDRNWIQEQLKKIANTIDFELSKLQPPLKAVSVFNKFFYDTFEFKTVNKREYEPRNFFINNVLYERKGDPVSITLLYLIVASKLKLPVCAVVVPEQLLLAYFRRKKNLQFFIRPDDQGAIFTEKELKKQMLKMQQADKEQFFHPCCNKLIIKLLLSELAKTYKKNQDFDRQEEMQQLSEMVGVYA